MTTTVLLAHGGPGATWQAMLVVAGVTLGGFLIAAAFGRVPMERPDDLVVPLAATAVVSSLGTVANQVLSDAIGWALPLLGVALGSLLLAAFTRLDVRFPAPLPMGAVALAAVSAMVLYAPLTIALHPPAELLPLSDDASVTIVSPEDGGRIAEDPLTVGVEVTGASLGAGPVPLEELSDDPEEGGTLAVSLQEVRTDDRQTQQQLIEPVYAETCTLEMPCDAVSFPIDPSPGTYELTVEFVRGDGTPLAPFVRDKTTFTVE